MAEIVYKYLLRQAPIVESSASIKWLDKIDLHIYNDHLKLCGQNEIDQALWDSIFDEGTMYAGLFTDGCMVARACAEKYSDEYWEVGDVRSVSSYQNRGYAHEICAFVMNYIVSNKKTPTIRTEESNIAMQKVIKDLGFEL